MAKNPKILILYCSRTGNTERMARFVAEGAESTGVDVVLKRVQDADVKELEGVDGLILGSPTYYGHSSGVMRSFIDKTVGLHGRLAGLVGGAFASSHNIGGGNETTVLDMLHALLIHGMIVQGSVDGDHYGPVSIGVPDHRAEVQCRELGQRVAELAKRLNV